MDDRARRPIRKLLWVLASSAALLLVGAAHGQTSPAPMAAATTAWSVQLPGAIEWQQIAPAGALLVETDGGLAGVDIEQGRIAWQKPELGGLAADSVQPVPNSLLMQATGPNLLEIFDPVTGAAVFDSRQLGITRVVTRKVLPQSGVLLIEGQREAGPPIVALFDLATGRQLWVNDSFFAQTGPAQGGFGGLMQGLMRRASESQTMQVLPAGPGRIVVYTLLGLRAMDARTGAVQWSAALPRPRFGRPPQFVRLYPSLAQPDRFYVSFDNSLMAYSLADGKALWAKPATVNGWIRDIVQHPAGIVMLPEAAPQDAQTGSRLVVNGIAQTGLNVARYADGTTIAKKPIRMHGNVTGAIIAGDGVVLAVDAQSHTYVNVLDVASATLRLKKDAKINGQLDYAELIPAGLLYVSRPDAATNAEADIIDLATGKPVLEHPIESGRPLSAGEDGYDAARYELHYAAEDRTLYIFANHGHQLYAINRDTGALQALGGPIKLQGGEDPTGMEIRPEGIVLTSPQNLVVVSRQGQIERQAYYPAPQLPGLLRALYAIEAVRAGLDGAAASAYGAEFAQAAQQAKDRGTQQFAGALAAAYAQGGRQLEGYSRLSAHLAMKRFKASLDDPDFVFMLTRAADGHGNVLLQLSKDTVQPVARVSLGKQLKPVYAVDDISDMLFLETAPGTLTGFRL